LALLIYVDESGQPYQIDEGPYVIASVAINENFFTTIATSINKFIEDLEKRFNRKFNELHTKSLVKGSNAWYNVPIHERAKVFIEFAQLISNQDLVLNIVAAVKKRPGVRISNPFGIRRHLIKLLVERLYLTPSSSEIGLIIVDSSTAGIDINVRREFDEGVRESLSQPTYRIYVTFSDSKREPPLQIADYVAYLMRHILMKQYRWHSFDFEKAFLIIESKIRKCRDEDTYEGCGLKVWEIG